MSFHRTLWEAASNKRLLAVAETIDGQIRLLINSSAAIPGRLPSSLAEHEAILQAVAAHDPDSAEAAMREHVQQAGRALERFLSAREMV